MRKRKDSFFGLHYDFHAGKNSLGLGNCDEALIDEMLAKVRPDFVQCDSKGHPGISSYPTKVGNPAPEMKGDLLKTWRKLTKKHDIALYAHHSGVWDSEAIAKNPDWAVVDENGNPSENITSVFGPYVDNLLIPQLIEIANDYGLDGAWVDGECWATDPDYSHYAVDLYKSMYGKEPPRKEDPDYGEYLDFCRDGFLKYVDRYMKEVHKVAPDFQLISNWLYTMYVVKNPEVDMDSISGDYDPNNSVNTARVDGRAIMSQQKPWDLMAWGFGRNGDSFFNKTTVQLFQEAAAVIMLGGGFQVYNPQVGESTFEEGCVTAGSIQNFVVPGLVDLAKFCRAREDICFKATPVHQIGIVYSEKGHNSGHDSLFHLGGLHYSSVKGTTLAVADCGVPVEILMTHHVVDRDISDFGLIIVPELKEIEPSLKEKLLKYAENGGILMIAGANTAKLFESELGVVLKRTVDNTVIDVDFNGFRTAVKTCFAVIEPCSDTRVIGEMFTTSMHERKNKKSEIATLRSYGKGQIAGVFFNIGDYVDWRSSSFRGFVKKVIDAVYTPSVRVLSKSNVDISLMKKNGLLCINLLNLNGEHADRTVCGFDYIPEQYNIELEIDCNQKPCEVRLEPEGIALPFIWESGVLKVKVERLDIHAVVTVK